MLDRVISSYTPTVRALAAARTRPRTGMAGQLLLIALPDTPGAGHLRYADQERAFVAELFAGQPHKVLAGTAATRRDILGGLATHTWAHAACHGTQNMADPSTGGLVPYDWNTAGLVSVLDLARADIAHGEFAFLSACQTATGGIGSLDEAINLAAALHYAGWRRVIGTLWTVWDDAAFQITRDTYCRLVHDGTFDAAGAAEALHHAVRTNRDQPDNRRQPSRWAPFLHTGP